MRAVIFAAGLGTRLYPFTKDRPKALVEVGGMTMLEHTLRKIRSAGILDVVVNVHAFANLVEEFLQSYSVKHPELTLRISDERDLLLETGGGLKKMQAWLEDQSFLVHNVDVLSTVNLEDLLTADAAFLKANPNLLATLAVRKVESDRYFLFNPEGILCGWENVRTGEQKLSRPQEQNLQRFGFTGIHLIHPALFPILTEQGVFSITDVYLRLAVEHEIRMFDVSDADWFDVGSPEQLKQAQENWSERCKK